MVSERSVSRPFYQSSVAELGVHFKLCKSRARSRSGFNHLQGQAWWLWAENKLHPNATLISVGSVLECVRLWRDFLARASSDVIWQAVTSQAVMAALSRQRANSKTSPTVWMNTYTETNTDNKMFRDDIDGQSCVWLGCRTRSWSCTYLAINQKLQQREQ